MRAAGTISAMASNRWLTGRGNAATKALRAAYPGIAVTYRVRFPHESIVTYTDGPSGRDADRALRRKYNVAHLSAAHLSLRRELTLTTVLDALTSRRFRPRTLSALQQDMHKVDVGAPSELAILLAGMYAGGAEHPTWYALTISYPALRRWLSAEREEAARAVLAPRTPAA